MQTEQLVFRNRHVCTYTLIHAKTIHEQRGHEFEWEQGEECRKFCGEKREGRNAIAILYS